MRHISLALRAGRALPAIKAIHVGSSAPADAEARVAAMFDALEWPAAERPSVTRSSVVPLEREVPVHPARAVVRPDLRANE
jgi:hypothetical protein